MKNTNPGASERNLYRSENISKTTSNNIILISVNNSTTIKSLAQTHHTRLTPTAKQERVREKPCQASNSDPQLPHPPPLHNPHNPHSPSQTHPQLDSHSDPPLPHSDPPLPHSDLHSRIRILQLFLRPFLLISLPILVRSTSFHAKFRFIIIHRISLNHYFAFLRNDAVLRGSSNFRFTSFRNTNFYFPPVWINSNFIPVRHCSIRTKFVLCGGGFARVG
jgi:hypothetical protein